MSKPTEEYTQSLGLDVGTSRIVVARTTDKKYAYESQLNAFLTLPYSKLAESLLQRENVFYEVRGAELIVMGNDAQRFAEVFHVETRRPMRNGTLNPLEPHSLGVLRSIIARLVGKAATENQKVLFSVPAPLPDGDVGIPYHHASI
jgi:actin-like ATPase involved in cell morphogenesis